GSEAVDNQLRQRTCRAGMDQTQVDPLESVVLGQSLDVLVGPPNRFLEFPTSFFCVDFKLLSLSFIKPLGGLQVPADVLISEQSSRLVPECFAGLRDGEDQGALEGAPGLAILADDLVHQLGCGRVAVDLVWGHDHNRQGGVIGNLASLVGEVDAIQGRAGLEDLLDNLLDPLIDGWLRDGCPPIGQQLVQVGSQAEPIAVIDAFQVVTASAQAVDNGLDVGDVQVRLGDGQADLGQGRLGSGCSSVRLEENHGRHFLVKPLLLDLVCGLTVEPDGVGLFLAGN